MFESDHLLAGVHVGATWRIRWNDPCSVLGGDAGWAVFTVTIAAAVAHWTRGVKRVNRNACGRRSHLSVNEIAADDVVNHRSACNDVCGGQPSCMHGCNTDLQSLTNTLTTAVDVGWRHSLRAGQPSRRQCVHRQTWPQATKRRN